MDVSICRVMQSSFQHAKSVIHITETRADMRLSAILNVIEIFRQPSP